MLATIYGVDIRTINYHIKKIYEDNELEENSTIRNFEIVQKEGNREVSRNVAHYNLQMIIAVGFKVNGDGEDRFYVMALEDFNDGNGPRYCWYYGASGKMTDYEKATSTDFGAGKENTEAMIARWNLGDVENGGYGPQNKSETYLDMWGVIQDKVTEEWFVSLSGEWEAFFDNLGITEENYLNYGLSSGYWASTQGNPASAYNVWLSQGFIKSLEGVHLVSCVRLSTIF